MALRPRRSPMPIATRGMLRISMLENFEGGWKLRNNWHRLGKTMISLWNTMTRKAFRGGKAVRIYVAVSTSLIWNKHGFDWKHWNLWTIHVSSSIVLSIFSWLATCGQHISVYSEKWKSLFQNATQPLPESTTQNPFAWPLCKQLSHQPHLRNYPRQFGEKMVNLFERMIAEKSGMPELPSSVPGADETFDSMDWGDLWPEAHMVSACHYIRAGIHLVIPPHFRSILPKRLWWMRRLLPFSQ